MNMNNFSDKIYKLFVLSKLKGVGPKTLLKISNHPDFSDCSLGDCGQLHPGIAKVLLEPSSLKEAEDKAAQDIKNTQENNARILCVDDGDYPPLLKDSPSPPFFLYLKGSSSVLKAKSVAIIGTREPTQHGEIIAQRITKYFAERGWAIVSGLAIGCDAIAHRTCIDSEGKTVAVLAHGLLEVVPAKHKGLADDIVNSGGALVTEYGFDVKAFKHQFVMRDRIQAGLASGVIMIQSDLKGGSLHASRAAINNGRILAVPAPTNKDMANGEGKIQANKLLSQPEKPQKAELLECKEDSLKNLFIRTPPTNFRINGNTTHA